MADNPGVPLPQHIRAALSAAGVVASCVLSLSCEGASPPTDPTNPTPTNTITITAAGVSPKDIQISPGSRVLFVNSDSRTHFMVSDPHPEHTDCTEINQIGLITVGQTKETENLNLVRLCRYHDHDLPNSEGLKGSITIR